MSKPHTHYAYRSGKSDVARWQTCRVCKEMFDHDDSIKMPNGRWKLFGGPDSWRGYRGLGITKEEYDARRTQGQP